MDRRFERGKKSLVFRFGCCRSNARHHRESLQALGCDSGNDSVGPRTLLGLLNPPSKPLLLLAELLL